VAMGTARSSRWNERCVMRRSLKSTKERPKSSASSSPQLSLRRNELKFLSDNWSGVEVGVGLSFLATTGARAEAVDLRGFAALLCGKALLSREEFYSISRLRLLPWRRSLPINNDPIGKASLSAQKGGKAAIKMKLFNRAGFQPAPEE
jgi:hypothetical protein